MSLAMESEPPPLQRDQTGAIRVGNSRVTLDLVVNSFHQGDSAESIAENHPSLTLAEVYAAIAYYLRHREAVERYMTERAGEAAELRRTIESRPANRELRERLIKRAREQGLRP